MVSLCSQDHIRSWSLEDIENCTSYSCSSGFLLEPLPYILQIKQEKADVVDIISGKLLLRLHSVNGSHIRTFCVCYDHLFLGGAVLVTGHGDGSIQVKNRCEPDSADMEPRVAHPAGEEAPGGASRDKQGSPTDFQLAFAPLGSFVQQNPSHPLHSHEVWYWGVVLVLASQFRSEFVYGGTEGLLLHVPPVRDLN